MQAVNKSQQSYAQAQNTNNSSVVILTAKQKSSLSISEEQNNNQVQKPDNNTEWLATHVQFYEASEMKKGF